MQKLSAALKNPPRDTSLVPCSGSSILNREETLGAQSKVRADNNPEENVHSGKSGQGLRVPVINMRGLPLMPTNPRKARILLNGGKAKVVSCKPFVIQLNYATGETKQPTTLGVDAGYSKIGFSAVSENKELMSGEVNLRNNVSKKLTERRMYRRNRRNRLWHREPRFNNRVSSKKKGWLAPSIQHKLVSHIKLIDKIKNVLPVSDVVIEVANFDIQKIKNPDIQGKEYQQGEQLGFYNVREYVLHRDNHICQHCKGKSKDKILRVHHIRGKKEGATDRPEELMTVCKTCHDRHHDGIDIIPIKKIKTFKPETFMTTVRWKLVNQLRRSGYSVSHTYGYITKHKRIKLGLAKSHTNDAFVIAGGAKQKRCRPFVITQTRRNNRSLQTNRKGFKPSIRRQRHRFQPNDMVGFKDGVYRVKGVFNYGAWIRLQNGSNTINAKTENVTLVSYGKGLQFIPMLK